MLTTFVPLNYEKVPIDAIPDSFWIALREDVRRSEGIDSGGCGLVTEYRDDARSGGWYHDADGKFADHYWFVAADGTIIDPTCDQWGDDHPMRIPVGHPLAARYVLHLPAGETDDACQVGPLYGFTA